MRGLPLKETMPLTHKRVCELRAYRNIGTIEWEAATYVFRVGVAFVIHNLYVSVRGLFQTLLSYKFRESTPPKIPCSSGPGVGQRRKKMNIKEKKKKKAQLTLHFLFCSLTLGPLWALPREALNTQCAIFHLTFECIYIKYIYIYTHWTPEWFNALARAQ